MKKFILPFLLIVLTIGCAALIPAEKPEPSNVQYVDELFGNFRYIPGTKTYEDQTNLGGSRANTLYKKYESHLVYRGKIQLFFRKIIYRSVYFTVRKIRLFYHNFL